MVAAMPPVLAWLFADGYRAAVLPLLAATLLLAAWARPASGEALPEGFKRFRFLYLVGWCLCVAADWIQGPYVYALYSEYGYSRHETAQLFVCGFASAMLCGFVASSLVDRCGRKRSALAYCVLYTSSCAMKHVNCFPVLLLGRALAGAATALLFSCFECWLVSEHTQRYKFSDSLLSYMFGAMFMCMYVMAIAAGVLAQLAVDHIPFRTLSEGSNFHFGGLTAPFDLAAMILVLGFAFIARYWDENYGSAADRRTAGGAMAALQEATTQSPSLWLVGGVVACFEGSMFAFVFNWTPALERGGGDPPLGLIFSCFMMACMCGACVSTVVAQRLPAALRLRLVCLCGFVAFAIAVCSTHWRSEQGCFLGFLLFEFAVGCYYPTVGVVKSEVVPESIRGAVYNMYRVPLNAVVVALLLTSIPLLHSYAVCMGLMILAYAGSVLLEAQRPAHEAHDAGVAPLTEKLSRNA